MSREGLSFNQVDLSKTAQVRKTSNGNFNFPRFTNELCDTYEIAWYISDTSQQKSHTSSMV